MTGHEVVAVGRARLGSLARPAADVDAVIHVAGVNRATDDELVDGNVAPGPGVSDALERRQRRDGRLRQLHPGRQRIGVRRRARPARPTCCGAAAGDGRSLRRRAACPTSSGSTDAPATTPSSRRSSTARSPVTGPEIADRPIELLHAQGAAQALLDALGPDSPGERAPGAHPDLGAGRCGTRSSGSTRPTSRAPTSHAMADRL